MSSLSSEETQKQLEEQVAVASAGTGCEVVAVIAESEISYPIKQDEFERLPDYVLDLIKQSDSGELKTCTHEELINQRAAFFTNCVSTNVALNDEHECNVTNV
jgi:hypothetical protein